MLLKWYTLHLLRLCIEEGQGKSPVDYFKEECTLMSKLRHPHIVQFLGICYPRGSVLPALVMELLMSCLHNYLEANEREKRAIPVAIKLSILLGVSKGLVYLHSKDIVHRDLTARNVLLNESLSAKIADLGMARLVSLHSATMTKAPGNVNYMPPEACGGNEYVARYGRAIDSFSLGHLTLFTITQKFLNPRNPTYFDVRSGKKQALTEIERRENSITTAHQLIGDHPLTRLAIRCLQDDPNKRPTAHEIMGQMEQMPIVPYRIWGQSKSELIQTVVERETTVSELQQENATLVQLSSGYQRSYQQVLAEKEQIQQKKAALVDYLSEYQHSYQKILEEKEILQQENATLTQHLSDCRYSYQQVLDEKEQIAKENKVMRSEARGRNEGHLRSEKVCIHSLHILS